MPLITTFSTSIDNELIKRVEQRLFGTYQRGEKIYWVKLNNLKCLESQRLANLGVPSYDISVNPKYQDVIDAMQLEVHHTNEDDANDDIELEDVKSPHSQITLVHDQSRLALPSPSIDLKTPERSSLPVLNTASLYNAKRRY